MPPRGGRKKRGGWRGGRGRGGPTRSTDTASSYDMTDEGSAFPALDASPTALLDGAVLAADLAEDSISEASDASAGDPNDLAVTSPPARNTLEREAGKLRARFRATRRAFFLAQIAEIDRRISDAQRDIDAGAEGGGGADARLQGGAASDDRAAKLRERHRMRVERVLADYRYRVKEADDELEVSESVLCASVPFAKPAPALKVASCTQHWLGEDIARMTSILRT